MQRLLAPIVLMLLVLLGAWWIWPRAETGAPIVPAPAAQAPAPARPVAGEAKVEAAAPAAERAEAAQPTADRATGVARLIVQCVARSDQRPLAGVRVHLVDVRQRSYRVGEGVASLGKAGDELITGSDGRVEFEVEPGLVLRLDAGDPAHFISQEGTQEIAPLAAGETREVTLVHDAGEGARFCGLVVAREDGRPLAGAAVLVDGKLRTSTDSAGRFELDYAPHLVPALRIDAHGFGPVALAAGPGHESTERARHITLERAAALEIALQVPEGQSAARVTLRTPGYEIAQEQVFASSVQFPDVQWEANADARWVCNFTELPPNARLVADVIGSTGVLYHAGEPIVLVPGEHKRLEWDLRGCELVGHVYEEDGQPAAGIGLWLLRAEPGYRRYLASYMSRDLIGRARSAQDGSFSIRAVSPGTWILAPEPVESRSGATASNAIAPAPLEVTIRSGELRSVVDVHLARGLYIRGTVVAPDGATGVQGTVFATSAAGDHLQANADAQGIFALGPLARGTFNLEGSPYNTYLSSLPVAADAGAKDVVLRSRPGAEVAGKVIDGASGAGVQAAITIGSDGGGMTMTRTQPDGSFRLDGLEPGRYTLFASTTAGQAGELPGVVLDSSAPVAGLEVVLKPGATLRIRYEGSGVGQASVRRNGSLIGGDGIEGGRNMLQVVSPGRIAVEFRYPDVEAPEVQQLEIAAGEEREVVFKAPVSK